MFTCIQYHYCERASRSRLPNYEFLSISQPLEGVFLTSVNGNLAKVGALLSHGCSFIMRIRCIIGKTHTNEHVMPQVWRCTARRRSGRPCGAGGSVGRVYGHRTAAVQRDAAAERLLGLPHPAQRPGIRQQFGMHLPGLL